LPIADFAAHSPNPQLAIENRKSKIPMTLFLLRHADADTEAATDSARRLSEKGIAQARKVARFCEERALVPELILTSPVRRADETARIVATHLRVEILTAPWLACGMSPEHALEELRGYERFERLMLVGHEPDFSTFAAHLLGLPGEGLIHVRKASLLHFDLPMLRAGVARLESLVPSRLM
jgi:phosphohistidine phosphatase